MERPVDQKLGVEYSLAYQRPFKGLKIDEIWMGTHEVYLQVWAQLYAFFFL